MKKEEYLSLIDEVIAQGPYTDTWDSLCEHPVPKWYARDKFGIFIHWGVYSVPAFGNEWYPRNMYIKGSKENLHHEEKYGTLDKFGYKDFIPQFKAEKFDPKEWAELLKEAGYIVLRFAAFYNVGIDGVDTCCRTAASFDICFFGDQHLAGFLF